MPDQFVPIYWASIFIIIINSSLVVLLDYLKIINIKYIKFIPMIFSIVLLNKIWTYYLYKLDKFFSEICGINIKYKINIRGKYDNKNSINIFRSDCLLLIKELISAWEIWITALPTIGSIYFLPDIFIKVITSYILVLCVLIILYWMTFGGIIYLLIGFIFPNLMSYSNYELKKIGNKEGKNDYIIDNGGIIKYILLVSKMVGWGITPDLSNTPVE